MDERSGQHASRDPGIPTDGAATRDLTGPGLWLGRMLGDRYRIERRLGSGGMGEVWQAFDLKLCVEVALKVMHPVHATAPLQASLRREVRAAREVVSPNVCRVFDLVESDGQELISMEFVDGTNLRDLLRLAEPPDLQRALRIAAQLLSGLQAIHDAGFVHRDLKPENVMITRTGRVILMDFGIAKALVDSGHGTVAGTPAYMAPEQARGAAVDARTDIYSAALVLAELLAAHSASPNYNVGQVLQLMRLNPPQPPPGPWCDALRCAAAWDIAERFPSARAFSQVLEQVTMATGGLQERCPYPGLASFSADIADLYFGREADIEALGRKLQRLHLLAVVGPSGVGKSSFLRAGVIPTLPRDWDCIYCTPGAAPVVALGQALAPRLAGDTEALRELLRFGEADVAVSMFTRWRRQHANALLVVDQFEELFTQNHPSVQSGFAELLGRLPLEADVRVLVAIRDDFLFHCHAHPGLRSIFVELTPLAPLRGPDLRRILVQPALACGLQFESDSMVDQMVAEVESERGALPLLAFTAAQLWERRDRGHRLLTAAAYQDLGGVAGSLAKHAEATLERIGQERQPMVREIFRNLVTARGTRVSCERQALLSLFEDPEVATEVLGQLVAARLLTAFEAVDPHEPSHRQQRLEIIHESLLTAWPRLVRWQTQDADGAQLRDQLRQAAQLWEERRRPDDLLWTGTVYQEFRLWHERHPVSLTGLEDAFSAAMQTRANRRRRRRRLALAGSFTFLLVVLAVVGTFWRTAAAEARRAESSKLYTLARNEILAPHAVAYAMAALELSDQSEYRQLALEVAMRGPLPFQLPYALASHNPWAVAFSPDGQWLAVGWAMKGSLQLYSLAGGEPRYLQGHRSRVDAITFTADSKTLITAGLDSTVRVWDVRDARLLRTISEGSLMTAFALPDPNRFVTRGVSLGERPRWKAWSVQGGEGLPLGRAGEVVTDRGSVPLPDVDATGTWAAIPMGRELFLFSLGDMEGGPVRLLGRHDRTIDAARFSPDGKLVAAWGATGDVLVWSLDSQTLDPVHVLRAGAENIGVDFDHSGTRIAVGTTDHLRVFDLRSPGSEPLVLPGRQWMFRGVFHPHQDWLVSSGTYAEIRAWSLAGKHPKTLIGDNPWCSLVFAPDGSWLVTASFGAIRLWPLDGTRVGRPRTLFEADDYRFESVSTDDAGRFIYASVGNSPAGNSTLVVVRISDGRVETRIQAGAAIPNADGSRTVSTPDPTAGQLPRLRNNVTGVMIPFGTVWDNPLGFDKAGRLLTLARDSLSTWDEQTWERRLLASGLDGIVILCPDRAHLLVLGADGRLVLRRLDGTEERMFLGGLDRRAYVSLATANPDSLIALGRRDGIEVLDVVSGRRWRLPTQGWDQDAMAFDPRGRWVATGTVQNAQLYDARTGAPVPEISRAEFLARLSALTNLRAVKDARNPTGYAIRGSGVPDWNLPPRW